MLIMMCDDYTAMPHCVADAAHCANMYPDSPDDLPQLRDARAKIHSLIGKWLSAWDTGFFLLRVSSAIVLNPLTPSVAIVVQL